MTHADKTPDMLFDFPASCENAVGTGAETARANMREAITQGVVATPQEGLAFVCGHALSGMIVMIEAGYADGEPLTTERRTALLMVYLHRLKQQMTVIEQGLIKAGKTPAPELLN